MILKKLIISNFKMFERLELLFEPGFNLILGDNGVGKTTILEAASVALSGFFVGMEDVSARNIYKDDVRYQIVKDNNGTPNKSYSSPIEISSTLEYNGGDYMWLRNWLMIPMQKYGLWLVIRVPPDIGFLQEAMQTKRKEGSFMTDVAGI